jgi:sterol desaturase/sphingolipid hydroxylase (fatty acid hydroxylase superfamily)
MHLYHHAYAIPSKQYGVNFGISLSVWDYLFGTHYIAESGGKIPLGFPGDDEIPKGFLRQQLFGFRRRPPKR